jgi:hypothetical protein
LRQCCRSVRDNQSKVISRLQAVRRLAMSAIPGDLLQDGPYRSYPPAGSGIARPNFPSSPLLSCNHPELPFWSLTVIRPERHSLSLSWLLVLCLSRCSRFLRCYWAVPIRNKTAMAKTTRCRPITIRVLTAKRTSPSAAASVIFA